MYITERAVFELRKDGVYLTEVAPGIDIKTQIIDVMGFEPKIDGEVKLMDERIFKDEIMGLKVNLKSTKLFETLKKGGYYHEF